MKFLVYTLMSLGLFCILVYIGSTAPIEVAGISSEVEEVSCGATGTVVAKILCKARLKNGSIVTRKSLLIIGEPVQHSCKEGDTARGNEFIIKCYKEGE